MDIVELQGSASHRVGHLGPLLIFAMVLFAAKAPRAPGPESLDRIRRNEEDIKGKSRGMVMAVLERGVAATLTRTFMAAVSLVMLNKLHVVKNAQEAAERVRGFTDFPSEITSDLQLGAKFEAFIAGER